MLRPFTYVLHPTAPEHLCITPDFEGPRFVGQIEAAESVVPLRLVYPVTRFVLRSFSIGRGA